MANVLISKKSNCKNCYKCIRHCPIKSIRFSGNQAQIIGDECILCGRCYVICPQNAKETVNEKEKIKVMMQSEEKVVASIAPSFISKFENSGIEAMEKALMKLGFFAAEETAVGATIVKKEYDRMIEEDGRDIIISSCCHSVNLLIEKYYPRAVKYLADVISPMQAHGMDIKRRYPGAKTVFIGPCISKKDEAELSEGMIDAVLTFEELEDWFRENDICPEKSANRKTDSKARLFPTVGGILKTMECRRDDYEYIAVDGIENCMRTLQEIEEGKLHKCFIEMSACEGSCINGPASGRKKYSPAADLVAVRRYAGENDFNVEQPDIFDLRKNFDIIENNRIEPMEYEIEAVMKQMGKVRKEDELNCGTCGYATCRDKAIAVCRGKAEIGMCLPFLKEKAESFSDTIVKNTPNAIVALNEKLEVQQINEAAREMMNIRYASDILGEPVVRILDPKMFIDVLTTGRDVKNLHCYLAEYEKYVEETIVYDKDSKTILAILKDITAEEGEREKQENMRCRTVEACDKVVEKQMRIVQEIASLLGETAAETKIALTKLKESINNE